MPTKNIVFIDSRVAGYQTLVNQLGADTEWYLLDANQDGIDQMQCILASYSGLDSVQVISHGSTGTLYLGSTVLNVDKLSAYQTQLEAIGSSLTETGDILLYGCSVAQGEVGLQFINTLALLTGADVAASTDATGSMALGGDGVLEASSSLVEAVVLNTQELGQTLAANTAPTFMVASQKITTSIGSVGDGGQSIALQSDGKILVGGYSYVSSTYTNADFALVRYNTDGTLDTSFSGDGKITTAIGSFSDFGRSVIVQADGKILVAGDSDADGANYDFALVRYNTDGTLDTSFSGDGILTTAIGSSYDQGYGVTVQADGKILVAGSSADSNGSFDFALVRYKADGSLDTSFSGDGILTTATGSSYDHGYGVTVQADGRILVAGYTDVTGSGAFALVRYNTDGSLDTTFSGDGIATTDVGLFTDAGTSVTVQADGKILVAGYSSNNYGYDFALVRYDIDGALDTSFSGDGMLTTDFGSSHDWGNSVTVQADGKILVAGGCYNSNSSSYDFALVRYNTDGTLDTSFSGDGMLTTDFGSSYDWGSSVTVQADGKILLAGSSNSDFALVRYNTDGSLDSTFAPLQNTLEGKVLYTESPVYPHYGYTPPAVLAPDAQILDAELAAAGNYAGATLTLARHGGANAQDVFSAKSSGTLSSLTAGGYFSVGSTTIGRVTGNASGSLTLVFNANATQALVNQALEQIAYSNISDAPPASVQIDWTFSDGNTGSQGTGGALSVTSSSTVAISPTNDSPVTNSYSLSAQTVSNGDLFSYTLPSNTFTDPDGDTLTYSVQMSDGTAMLPWLSIDATTGTLSGTPDILDAGTFYLTIVASDGGYRSSTSAGLQINVNGKPTGEVSIAGDAIKGQLLTASNTLADVDGMGEVSYQWFADNTPISNATGATWTLTQAQVGKALSVVASYTDSKGMATTVSSPTMAVIAAGGNLTPSFGVGDGKVTTNFGGSSSYEEGQSVAIQSDGQILVAGSAINDYHIYDFALARYNTDGTLDTSFSGDGMLITSIGLSDDRVNGVTMQADGKILAAGVSSSTRSWDFVLARYKTNGSLDTTFSGDGIATTAIGSSDDWASSVAVQVDGKILVGGSSANNNGNTDLALARYNADGTLDTSFSGDGMLTTAIGLSSHGNSVTVQANGKILVAGSTSNGNNSDLAVVRYNTDGSLDTSFGSDGIIVTKISQYVWVSEVGRGVTLQTDGKILVAGYVESEYTSHRYLDFALIRYNTDGTLDTSFSGDGILATDFGSSNDWVNSVIVQADGKILVAGNTSKTSTYNDHSDFALVRYNTDGSLDTTFSGDGILTTDFGSFYDAGSSVTVQVDGKILVAGSSSSSNENTDFALARYNPDGSLDLSFDVQGLLDGTVAYAENASPVILDGDVLIHDQDLATLDQYTGATLTLARNGGAQAEDRFSGAGIVAGQASGDVTIGSTTVGTYNWDAGTLTIAFNESATQALVNQTAQAIAYQNTNDAPVSSVQIDWTFSDGNTGTQGSGGELTATGSTTVNITPANDAPSGAVTISGSLQQGETLTASNTLTDPDGMGTVSYQWLANGVAITGAANKSLTLGQNQVGKTISVTASYTDGQGTAESVASEQTPEVVQAAHLAGMVYHWKNHALLDGVDIQISGADGDFKSHSVQGSFNFNELAADSYQLIVSWAAGHQGNAVTVSDALAALRIFQALNPNPDSDGMGPLPAPLLSPYQVMAADVDGDKKVTMADVEGILRMAVNAEGALVPEWRFVEETRDFWDEASALYTLTGASAGWAPEILTAVGPHGSQENLVAVLMGDVNGSWDAIAGAEYLEDAYFDELATMIGVPAWQWAV